MPSISISVKNVHKLENISPFVFKIDPEPPFLNDAAYERGYRQSAVHLAIKGVSPILLFEYTKKFHDEESDDEESDDEPMYKYFTISSNSELIDAIKTRKTETFECTEVSDNGKGLKFSGMKYIPRTDSAKGTPFTFFIAKGALLSQMMSFVERIINLS
jgi:hypothetical protein